MATSEVSEVEREVLATEEALRAIRRAGWDQTVSERVRDVKDAIKEALAGSR